MGIMYRTRNYKLKIKHFWNIGSLFPLRPDNKYMLSAPPRTITKNVHNRL